MNYSEFRTIYLNRLKFIIEDLEFKQVHMHLFNSFEEKFEIFNKSEVNFASLWFETLLDRFISVIENVELNLENRLTKVIDLMLELELKTLEIEQNMDNIFKKIDYKKHGIA